MATAEVNKRLWEVATKIYEDTPEDFPKAIQSADGIPRLIQVNQTLRRSSKTQATRCRVLKDDKEIANCWSKKLRAKGKAPVEPMRLGYAKQDFLDDCFRQYTKVM